MTTPPAAPVDAAARRHLIGVAYRMLGSVAEAEDAVQEGYARWYALSAEQQNRIDQPIAWMTTTVSRICLDVLKSARVRRESYIGPWLPEPVPGHPIFSEDRFSSAARSDPLDRISRDESVSMAVMVLLERLSPAQRVSLVLHDVFGFSFTEVADITGRTPGACRELASQARRRVRSNTATTETSNGELAQSVAAFKLAWETGDIAALVSQLSNAAIATIDGGGRVTAALDAIVGAEDIAQFFIGVRERQADLGVYESLINGAPGLIACDSNGSVLATVSIGLQDSKVASLWVVRNPEKLVAWSKRHHISS